MKLDSEIDGLISVWSNVDPHACRFEISRKLKSQNELKGNTRDGSYLYAAERAWWHRQFTALLMAKLVTKADGPRYVRITRIIGPGGKLMDVGNMIGGCKALVDAMVNTGLLVDDSPGSCSIFYRQHDHQKRNMIGHAVAFELWGEYQGDMP